MFIRINICTESDSLTNYFQKYLIYILIILPQQTFII